MAYRLRSQESVTHGLRRIAKKEVQAARDEMRRSAPPSDEAVHEARKSVKKVRAIVELIEADGGKRLGNSRKRLRSVNRKLSRLRDADAMIEALTKLRSRNARLFSEHTFARVRRLLWSHKQDAMNAAEQEQMWESVARTLRKVRRQARRWQPVHGRFGTLARGIRTMHRRGRKSLRRARSSQRAEDFHRWRKAIKALWYELRLIEACDRTIQRDVDALHRAETLLGDEHNIVVLCAELSKDSSVCGETFDLSRLQSAAGRYQRDLRKKAIAIAGRIFNRTSRDYARGVKRVWRHWRQRETGDHQKPQRSAA
jgi:CHAD domain-containing protein